MYAILDKNSEDAAGSLEEGAAPATVDEQTPLLREWTQNVGRFLFQDFAVRWHTTQSSVCMESVFRM